MSQTRFNPFTLILNTALTPLSMILLLYCFWHLMDLDVVQTTQQIGNASASPSVWKTIANIYSEEGLKGFSKSFLVQYLLDSADIFIQRLSSKANNPFQASFLFGLSHFLMYPLKVARTRLIQQRKNYKYKGLFDCLVKLIREQPVPLFRGVYLELIRLFISKHLKEHLFTMITQPAAERIPLTFKIFASLPSDLLIGFLTYPLLTIVTKLQAQDPTIKDTMKCDISSTSTLDCIREIYKKDGILGFYSGFSAFYLKNIARYLTIVLSTQVFVKVDFLKDYFLTSNQPNYSVYE